MISSAQAQEIRERLVRLEIWITNGPRTRSRRRMGCVSYREEEVPNDCRVSNEEREALELYKFTRDRPVRYFAYLSRDWKHVTTWFGGLLASVIWTGKPFECPAFGRPSQRLAFRCRAITGDTYAGIAYLSTGEYCCLRKVKP